MARPRFSPTAEQRRLVKVMAGLGVPQEQIASVLDISPHTLRRHFRRELDCGVVEANAKVLQALYGMATSGKNTAASIFWAKTRCGLRERERESGADRASVAAPALVVQIERPLQ